MASRFSQSSAAVAVVANHFNDCVNITSSNTNSNHEDGERSVRDTDTASSSYGGAAVTTTSMAYLPQTVVLCELRHEAFEGSVPSGPSDSGLVSKWRPRDRVSCPSAPHSCFRCSVLLMLSAHVHISSGAVGHFALIKMILIMDNHLILSV